MKASAIDSAVLTKAALTLFDEGYSGPADPKGTWFVDNEPDCGFLGTIGKLGAEEASRPCGAGDPLTVAAHAAHLRFSLSLANRAVRGENAYAGADWAKSWSPRSVSDGEWKALVSELRSEYLALRAAIEKGDFWGDDDILTGTLGLLCHGAWHLGAIRQALGLIKAPE